MMSINTYSATARQGWLGLGYNPLDTFEADISDTAKLATIN
jgi:hypothetical protein